MPIGMKVNLNQYGWGPDLCDSNTVSTCLQNLTKYPFEPSIKAERLGRVCDFTFASYQRNIKDNAKFGNLPPGYEEESKFQTVDTRPTPKVKGRYNQRKVQKQTAQAYAQKEMQEAELQGRQKKIMQKKQLANQIRFQRMYNRNRTFAEWSIEPTNEWVVEGEIQLNQLRKQHVAANDVHVEDICWKGEVKYYNKDLERQITSKTSAPLSHLSNSLDFYWISTSDDAIIKEQIMREDKKINAVATDQILACLMAASQSKYSWHINVTKIEDKLIFDKTDGSIVDLLTVNETATEPPPPEDPNKLNRPPALGFEAVKINQNFRQATLKNEVAELHEKPPFVESGDTPASIAYRYRMFTLPPLTRLSYNEFEKHPVTLVTRGEVNAKILNSEPGNGYVSICALNEYDLKNRKNWRCQIENQRGALFATEIRNNANKLQKWVAQAMISGCEQLKLGYITRKAYNDAENHLILSIQSYKTDDLGIQIGLKPENAWGIIRSIIDLLMQKSDGRYVLLKDPMQPIIRLYKRPDDEEIDEDEGEDEGEDEENNEKKQSNPTTTNA